MSDVSAVSLAAALSNAAVNYGVSPKYQEMQMHYRAPAQPARSFFAIWGPLFGALALFGLRGDSREFQEAKKWHAISNAGGIAYGGFLYKQNAAAQQLSMFAMLASALMARKRFEGRATDLLSRSIRLGFEGYIGWMSAACAVISLQNVQLWRRRAFEARANDTIGIAEAVGLTALGAYYARGPKWPGASAAIGWALLGAAVDSESRRPVRGAAAIGTSILHGLLGRDLIRTYRSKSRPNALA